MGRSGLHGNGYNRWFDKSMTVSVYSNGTMVSNFEHSWADAPVSGHVFEYIHREVEFDKSIYKEDGHCSGVVRPLYMQLWGG